MTHCTGAAVGDGSADGGIVGDPDEAALFGPIANLIAGASETEVDALCDRLEKFASGRG